MQNRKQMHSLFVIIIIVIITLSNQCVGEGLHVDSRNWYLG